MITQKAFLVNYYCETKVSYLFITLRCGLSTRMKHFVSGGVTLEAIVVGALVVDMSVIARVIEAIL
jgi:hypothetical protein